MYQLHDFSVYHPNSYIASRRSSLPRQGYGGVYERQNSSLWPAARHRDLKGFPRHLSEYSFWAASPPKGGVRTSATAADLRLAGEEEARVEREEEEEKEEEEEGEEDEEVRISRRVRGPEELRLVKAVRRGRRAGGEEGLPSDELEPLASELLGMDSEDGASDDEEESPTGDWRPLLGDFLAAKELARSGVERQYRDAKRQVTQLRPQFERGPDHVISRFDRLVADVTCFSRLAAQLARQCARLARETGSRPAEVLLEEKRRALKRQLAELPRLRASLIARQTSLRSLLPDPAAREAFAGRMLTFWSLAAHVALLEAELALDADLRS